MKPNPTWNNIVAARGKGHLWLAISTDVAAENRPKDDVVSCRVCFVLGDIVGEFVDPNVMKDQEAVVSRWVCGFMLGLERILWCFSCCFVSGLCLWCLVHWNSWFWKRQSTTNLCSFSAMAWTEQNTLFHVGLGFRVGFAGAQKNPYVKSPPERVPGDKFLSLPWKMWWNFRKFWEWQILSHFPWETMQENSPPKIHRVFHTGGWGGGGKNAKFHHLNLLGAALRKESSLISEETCFPHWLVRIWALLPPSRKKQGLEGQGSLKSFFGLELGPRTLRIFWGLFF